MADADWDNVINGLKAQITQMQQVITAQQAQIILEAQKMVS